jgi:hypothetical protein
MGRDVHDKGLPVPAVYCWKCFALADAGDIRCPACGAVAPGRGRPVYGPLALGLLAAGAVTAGYAWMLGQVWERWERKFAALRENHPLHGEAEPAAVALGAAVFLAAWAVAVARLRSRPA